MKILAIDIGTGTQDILLFDTRLSLENAFKLVLPSPTMIVHRRIKQATARGAPILLAGRQMGGGPSAWAAQEHARLGLPAYSTPAAAVTLDDDLAKVSAMGVTLVSDDEARHLPAEVQRIDFGDFDIDAITSAFTRFGVGLDDLEAVGVAVFDHGAAPRGVSDRQFRFDYLDRRIRQQNSLTAFAYLADDAPLQMTRLRSVAESAPALHAPLVVMDTAPAAVLGATFDPLVARQSRQLVVNIGNFHALAFRLHQGQIEGIFEHHTGEVDASKLEDYLVALAEGTLKHEDVFDDMGHGALIYKSEPLELGEGDFDVVVTGPRRSMLRPGDSDPRRHAARLRPYFAVPFGDMMLSGCFGLLAAVAELVPETADAVNSAIHDAAGSSRAPWETE